MEEPTFTVAELSAGITRALTRAYPDDVWVRGEIRNLNRAPSGHVYFSLIDPAEGPEPAAQLPVTLFAADKDAVNRVLIRSGALRMTDGVEVRIRGRVTHYAARGVVQLRMTWIDTDYTIGRLAADRERLLRSLAAEGLLERNAAVPFPLVPLQIGLLTSAGSAAEADFLEILRSSGYGFRVLVADTRVQGPDAPASLQAGLAALADEAPDVIAVVRGGGAATDLAAFDDEGVARAIATVPLPVLAGIGHEIDTTVADRVAGRSLPTPTACASALVDRVGAFLRTVDALEGRVAGAAGSAVRRHRTRLDDAGRRLAGAAAAAVRVERTLAATRQRRLTRETERTVARARRRVDTAASRVLASDPQRLLAQGWSITRDHSGALVRSTGDVAPGAELWTLVADGSIGSTVTETGEGGRHG